MLHSNSPPHSSTGAHFFRRKRLYAVIGLILVLFWIFSPWTTLSYGSSTEASLESVEELHGLLYMVSHTNRILPAGLNPNDPLKPSLWSTPRGRWSAALQRKEVMEALNKTPVVVFSKTYCPYSRAAKDLLQTYELKPPPKIVEVDTRADGDILKRLLLRLTAHGTFPNVVVNGKSLGGSDDVRRLHETGKLKDIFLKANVDIRGNIAVEVD